MRQARSLLLSMSIKISVFFFTAVKPIRRKSFLKKFYCSKVCRIAKHPVKRDYKAYDRRINSTVKFKSENEYIHGLNLFGSGNNKTQIAR